MGDSEKRGVADGEEVESLGATSQGTTSTIETSLKLKNKRSSFPTTVNKTSGDGSAKFWTPDIQLVQQLTSMGISKEMATKALFYTGNDSAEEAVNWIFENNHTDLSSEVDCAKSSDATMKDVYKMAFVVNTSLKMGLGKTCAQVAHAALGIYQLLLQDENTFGYQIIKWSEFGETKIVLRGESTQHLVDLEKKALELGLPTYLVHDAGKTQVPSGSTTVLCIFGRLDIVDEVTSSLVLL